MLANLGAHESFVGAILPLSFPQIGTTLSLISIGPPGSAIFAFDPGTAGIPLPPYGMLLAGDLTDLNFFAFTGTGTPVANPIPGEPALLGLRVHLQAPIFSAGSPAGAGQRACKASRFDQSVRPSLGRPPCVRPLKEVELAWSSRRQDRLGEGPDGLGVGATAAPMAVHNHPDPRQVEVDGIPGVGHVRRARSAGGRRDPTGSRRHRSGDRRKTCRGAARRQGLQSIGPAGPSQAETYRSRGIYVGGLYREVDAQEWIGNGESGQDQIATGVEGDTLGWPEYPDAIHECEVWTRRPGQWGDGEY
jgi:hypothetical protein